jgi:hypothetical protein
MNANTNHHRKPISVMAQRMLASDRGSFVRVARRMKVSRSHVSKVFNGARRSRRIRRALLRQAMRIAIRHGYRLAAWLGKVAAR